MDRHNDGIFTVDVKLMVTSSNLLKLPQLSERFRPLSANVLKVKGDSALMKVSFAEIYGSSDTRRHLSFLTRAYHISKALVLRPLAKYTK